MVKELRQLSQGERTAAILRSMAHDLILQAEALEAEGSVQEDPKYNQSLIDPRTGKPFKLKGGRKK